MIQLDEKGKITCPVGDTGLLLVELSSEQFTEPLNGVAIFAVTTKNYTTILKKTVELVDNTATIRLANRDTRGLSVGEHMWDVRIVIDPEYEADGTVIVKDDTDEVHSLFSAGGMPAFVVTRVAVEVSGPNEDQQPAPQAVTYARAPVIVKGVM